MSRKDTPHAGPKEMKRDFLLEAAHSLSKTAPVVARELGKGVLKVMPLCHQFQA